MFNNPVSTRLPMVKVAMIFSSCPPCILGLYISGAFFLLPAEVCFGPWFLFASPRRVDGGLVQVAVTPPAPSFPLYDDEVQGEFLWWVFLWVLMVPPLVDLSFCLVFRTPTCIARKVPRSPSGHGRLKP